MSFYSPIPLKSPMVCSFNPSARSFLPGTAIAKIGRTLNACAASFTPDFKTEKEKGQVYSQRMHSESGSETTLVTEPELGYQGPWSSSSTLVSEDGSIPDDLKNAEETVRRPTEPIPTISSNTLTTRKTHYFLNHILPILEDACHEWARPRYFKEMLDTPAWIKKNLPEYLHKKEWTTKGKVERYHWTRFFKEFANLDEKVLESAGELRHCAIHRRKLSTSDLLNALRLPAVLGDSKRAAQLDHQYKLFTTDSPTPAERMELFCILNPTRRVMTETDLAAKVQDVLEETVYMKFEKENPELLREMGWACYEQVEITTWITFLNESRKGDKPFTDTMDAVRTLRNYAVHRLPIYNMRKLVQPAVLAAYHLGEPVQAREIQNIINAWIATERGEGRDHEVVNTRRHSH